jgi:hypothetical protein
MSDRVSDLDTQAVRQSLGDFGCPKIRLWKYATLWLLPISLLPLNQ